MIDWDEALASATLQFTEALQLRGFLPDGDGFTGEVAGQSGPVPVRVTLDDRFPFSPPIVTPPTEFPVSWHRERDGAMCLYPSDGREALPWLDVDGFLELVGRWLRESATGWTGDMPDLDLDRYFPPAPDRALVVYGDLDPWIGRYVQLRKQGATWRITGPGAIPNRQVGEIRGRAFGFAADIGDPQHPPRGWVDLTTRLPPDEIETIERAIRAGRLTHLIVRYQRRGRVATVILRTGVVKGEVALASVPSASEAPAVLAMRAGPSAPRLAESRVVVVGVGAIGSFLCDLLVRAGVGQLTIYDPDIVRPGNLIRHLVGPDMIGLSKADAVERTLRAHPFSRSAITPVRDRTPDPRDIMGLFAEADLVIDAAADGATTNLLVRAAEAGEHRFLSACVQLDGRIVRVDVIPPLEGAPLDPVGLGTPLSEEQLLFESGCGDPVSQTPAFAVQEAAALAARHAIGLLTGVPVTSAGVVHDYR